MSASDHINEHVRGLYESLKAEHPDVRLGLQAQPDKIHLDLLIVPEGQRGQGIGSSIIRRVTATADELGVPTTVTPSTDFGGTKSGLDRLYRRHGFKPNRGRTRDFSTRASMIRFPR